MALYILRPKLINSWDFFKNFEKSSNTAFQKASYFFLHSSFLSNDS